jgi:hypothetical protein
MDLDWRDLRYDLHFRAMYRKTQSYVNKKGPVQLMGRQCESYAIFFSTTGQRKRLAAEEGANRRKGVRHDA